MTGNIAFLGLQVAGNSAPGMVSILVSMIAFALGVYVSTRIVSTKDSGVWSQKVTIALAVGLIAHAAFLVLWFEVGGQPSINASHYLLGFWAYAMGMQSAAVRRLHVDGVFTTAATATFIFLAGDITNWSATAPERRRLTGVLISLFLGATAGGLLLLHAELYAPVLPFLLNAVVVVTSAVVLREPVKSKHHHVHLKMELK